VHFRSKVDWWLVGVLVASLVASGVAALGSGMWPGWLAFVLVATIVPWILLQTDYELTESALKIRCGFYRTSVAVADILALEASHNPRSAPALSLDRIDVRHRRGHVLISPRDREAFVEAVRERVPRLEVVGLPGATTDAPAPMGSPRVRLLAVAVVAVTLAIAAALIAAGSRPPVVTIEGDIVKVHNALAWTSFTRDDVVEISLTERWPHIGPKLFGFAALGSLRGRFRVEGLGDGYVFAEQGRPFVRVRTAHSFVLIGFDDANRTRQIYSALRPPDAR